MKNKAILVFCSIIIIFILFNSCQTEQDIIYARYYVNGKGFYEQHCQNCHSKDGLGLQALIPPLTDSIFLLKNKNKLACFVKQGMDHAIIINGKLYEGNMPAQTHLANIDIAAVITYVTNSFGNNQGLYDVKSADADLETCD